MGKSGDYGATRINTHNKRTKSQKNICDLKKVLIKQHPTGEYDINDSIILEIQSHGMTTPKNWRYMT